jgi:hypothetical protein
MANHQVSTTRSSHTSGTVNGRDYRSEYGGKTPCAPVRYFAFVHSAIPVCGATAKGEASNQPNRPRVLEAVEGVLVLKAPAFTFIFADGILRCSRRGCANLACCRGEARGKTMCRCSKFSQSADRKCHQDLTHRAQCGSLDRPEPPNYT